MSRCPTIPWLTSSFARRCREVAAATPGCWSTDFTLFRSSSQGRVRSSQVPCQPFVPMPCSQTPVGPPHLALSVFRFCPPVCRPGRPQRFILSRLNHTACALTVYASCRPLGRRRKTRFRWRAKPCRMGFYIPIELVWRVSLWRSPLPGLFLARSG